MFSKLCSFVKTPISVGNNEISFWKLGLASLTTLGVTYGIYSRLTRPKYNSSTTSEEIMEGISLDDKIIIITGCSAGIGKETARYLVGAGAKVIMACRNLNKTQKVKQEIIESFEKNKQKKIKDNLDIISLDLSSLDSVYNFYKSFISKYNRLDILINNAGVMGSDIYTTTSQDFELQLGVNHIGHFYLTLLLTNVLKLSKSVSRVLVLTSKAHVLTPKPSNNWLKLIISSKFKTQNIYTNTVYDKMDRYCRSKAVNILFAREYHKRYNKDGINCVSIHPGLIFDTEMGTANNKLDNIKTILLYPILLYFNKSLSQGTATTLRCVTLSDKEMNESAGHYFSDCRDEENSLRYDFQENKELNELSKQLFDVTKQVIESKGFKFS